MRHPQSRQFASSTAVFQQPAKRLRTAVQVVRGLFGRHRGARDLFQRGKMLGLGGSAAGALAVLDCGGFHRFARQKVDVQR